MYIIWTYFFIYCVYININKPTSIKKCQIKICKCVIQLFITYSNVLSYLGHIFRYMQNDVYTSIK